MSKLYFSSIFLGLPKTFTLSLQALFPEATNIPIHKRVETLQLVLRINNMVLSTL